MRQSLDRILQERYFQMGRPHWWKFAKFWEPESPATAAARADDQDLATMRERSGVWTAARHDPEASLKRILIFTFPWPKQRRTLRSVPDRFHRWMLGEQRHAIFYVDGGRERGQVHHKRISMR